MHPRRRAIIRLSSALGGLRPGHWVSGLASQLGIGNTLQQGELYNAVQNLAGRMIRTYRRLQEGAGGSTMATNPNSMVQEAVDTAIRKHGEIGLQVVAYVDGKQVVDVWGGLADITTGRQVDADTLFPVFSVTKAVTAVALHIQAERGLVDYAMPIAHYWPEFGAHGKD